MADLKRIFKSSLRAVAKYIESEKGDPIGKVNLGLVVLFGVFFLVAFVPSLIKEILIIVTGRDTSWWDSAQPLLAFLAVVWLGGQSLKLLPPTKPSL